MVEGFLLRGFPIANRLDSIASTSRRGRKRILNCLISSVAPPSGLLSPLREDLPLSSRGWACGVVGKRSSMKFTMHTRLR